MPLDNYFTSGYKRGRSKSATMATKHRLSWPDHTKHARRVKLFMRLKERAGAAPGVWFHVIDVPEPCADEEIAAWEAKNPAYEFRLDDRRIAA